MPAPTASDPRLAELDAAVERALDHIPADFGGGCSVGKARVMARLIVEHDVDTAVEVGFYRGRSYIPLALAMRARGTVRAIGVDPWAAEPAMQYDDHGIAPEVLHGFVQEADWDGIKAGVDAAIEREGVAQFTELIRDTSMNAATRFAPS